MPNRQFFDKEVCVVIDGVESPWKFVSRAMESLSLNIVMHDVWVDPDRLKIVFKYREPKTLDTIMHLQHKYVSQHFVDFAIAFPKENAELKAHAVILTQSPVFKTQINSMLGSKDNQYVENKYTLDTVSQVVESLYSFRVPEFADLDKALAYVDACIFFDVPSLDSIVNIVCQSRIQQLIGAENLKKCARFAKLHESVSVPFNTMMMDYIKRNPDVAMKVLASE